MYYKHLEEPASLADNKALCKQAAHRLKKVIEVSDPKSVEERVALLPSKLMRYVFKNQIGQVPYEIEECSSDRAEFYKNLNVTGRLNEIDRDYVEVMSGAKFSSRGPNSPQRSKYIKARLQ